ncbi:MAG: hypothetical protein ACKO4T_10260 [Planctomycetaceae bacterium]
MRRGAAIGLAIVAIGASAVHPRGSDPRGSDAAEPVGLDAAIEATWTGVPIREWALRVSEIAGVPIVVDRRLDASTTITLSTEETSLRTVLERVAAELNATVEPFGGTVLLVPSTAAGTATAAASARADERRRLRQAGRRTLDGREAWTWPAAARPRDLIANAADAAGIAITGLDRIPHDHLPAASLPPLPLGERLDLVLVPYGLRVSWSASGGSIEPIVATPAAARPAQRPTAVDPRRQSVADRARNGRAAGERYTLRLESPLDQAVNAIAVRLGLEAALDAASLQARGVAPGEIIRVEARDVTRDELLDAIVAPLGLAWTIDAGVLTVFAAPRSPGASP